MLLFSFPALKCLKLFTALVVCSSAFCEKLCYCKKRRVNVTVTVSVITQLNLWRQGFSVETHTCRLDVDASGSDVRQYSFQKQVRKRGIGWERGLYGQPGNLLHFPLFPMNPVKNGARVKKGLNHGRKGNPPIRSPSVPSISRHLALNLRRREVDHNVNIKYIFFSIFFLP